MKVFFFCLESRVRQQRNQTVQCDRFQIDYLVIIPLPANLPTHVLTLKLNSESCYQILRFPGHGVT